MIGMVKSLAIELGPRGIRANALLPGIVEGERQNRVIEAKAKVKNISFDDMKDEILSGASLNRFVTHDDLAEQAHFLCSPLGKNISGQAVSVVEILKRPVRIILKFHLKLDKYKI